MSYACIMILCLYVVIVITLCLSAEVAKSERSIVSTDYRIKAHFLLGLRILAVSISCNSVVILLFVL